MDSTHNYLISLKSELASGNVSLLVGAGFSKNVSSKYLSWDELLYDMARFEIYDTVNKEFLLLGKDPDNESEFQSFLSKQVKLYISQKGYIQLVSNYVQKKGYSEAIASYIEERIPFASKDNDQYHIRTGDGKEETINPVNFELHKRLLSLPWSNIFTTNYDNLLECSIDQNIEQALQNKISEIKLSIEEKQKAKKSLEEMLEDLRVKYDEFQRKMSLDSQDIDRAGNLSSSQADLPVTNSNPDMDTLVTLQKLEIEISTVQRRIEDADQFIKEKYAQREEFHSLIGQCYSVVTHSSQLAIKANKNIIKLHGTLRESPNAEFGFDSDPRNHYIISGKDYRKYPDRHEAFTQLMRISLLQQSFCLIGFSGEDPNFLEWIGWVRDIIQRKSGSKNTEKVYLVSFSDQTPSSDRQLFYKNHQIAYIPLKSKAIYDFLKSQSSVSPSFSREDNPFSLLFDYLQDEVTVNTPQLAVEFIQREEYRKFWTNLDFSAIRKQDYDKLLDFPDFPEKFQTANTLNNLSGFVGGRHTVLSLIPHDLPDLTKNKTRKVIRLFAQAIQDEFLPLSAVLDQNSKSFSHLYQLSGPELDELIPLSQILLSDTVWRNSQIEFDRLVSLFSSERRDELSEFITYCRCLLLSINLDFSKLKEHLDAWSPSEKWVTQHAGLCALMDQEGSLSQLSTVPHSVHDLYYRLELAEYLERSLHPFKFTENRKLQRLKREGVKGLKHNFEYLLSSSRRSKEQYKPYGHAKYSVGTVMDFSRSEPEESYLQFLGLLLASGFPMSLPHINYYDSNTFYPIAKSCINYYPFPVVFFALQYSSKDFLKRLGQDIAYSEPLRPDLEQISANMQCAYLSEQTPSRYKKSILTMFSEMLVAIDPGTWNTFLGKVWRLEQNAFFQETRYYDQEQFLFIGLRYSTDPDLLQSVILDCLNQLFAENQKGETEIIVSVLYYISLNGIISRDPDQVRSKQIAHLIDKVIQSLAKDTSYIFVLGNLHELITSDQMTQIRAQFVSISMDQIQNDRVWRIMIFFADKDTELLRKIADSIAKNPKLWEPNISNKSASSLVEYIPLRSLRKNPLRANGLKWTEQNVKVIYKSLKTALNKISGFLAKHDDLKLYPQILREMLSFLEDEIDLLNHEPDFDQVIDSVRQLYAEQCGFDNYMTGLESPDQSHVLYALAEISSEVYYKNNIAKYIPALELIIQKLYFQNESAQSACLTYLSNLLYDFNEIPVLREKLGGAVLALVKKYNKRPPSEIEVPFLLQKMVKLATVLNEWGVDDPIVPHYMIMGVNTHFNNIRNDHLGR